VTAKKTDALGVIGTGLMGLGMVESLRRHAQSVVVCDTNPQRILLAQAYGAIEALTPSEVAKMCSQIFIVVVNAQQIDAVLQGANGLLAALRTGTQVFICSTIAPADTERFSALVAQHGGVLIDAPISGGPAKAHTGTMTMMLAGPSAEIARAMPVITQLSGPHFLISEKAGDAAKAKLVNNMLAAAHLAAAAEAFSLARAFGLDQAQLLKLVSSSSGQSWMADERIGRALVGDMTPRAQMHVLTKDVTLAVQAAEQAGMRLRVGELARQIMQEGCDAGFRYQDDAALLEYAMQYHQQAGSH
jgi:L-threonate 2-dehydrogenase